MSSLGNRERRLLLEVARRALSAAVEGRKSPGDLPPGLEFVEVAGVFVTLRRRGRLRGCIGQIESVRPLVEVVDHCAKTAALEDPRFDAVRRDELAEIEIEISVLSRFEEIAPHDIEAGKHGLMVSRGRQRGILLPQVAMEFRWQAPRFLEETCVKAGLDRNAWQNAETTIHGFTADVFRESNFSGEGHHGPSDRTKPRYSIST